MAKIKGDRNIFIVIGIILGFILISFIYFSPQLQGKHLEAGDLNNFKGGAKELIDFRNNTGDEALWTNSMFGGMPGYLISVRYTSNLMSKVQSALNVIPRPAGYLVLIFTFFFIMLLVLGTNPWLSLVGALSFGFSTYFFVLMEAGHMSKVHTLAFMSLVVAGILVAYKKNRLLGSVLTAIGLSWMLAAGHPQMTYYAGLMVLIIGITYLVDAIRQKTLTSFLKTSALLVVALILSVGTSFSRLYTTYEYGQYSIRGKSELTDNTGGKSSGLDKDYILNYSYDLGEALTAFIPRFKGGGMAEALGENSNFYQLLEKSQGKARARQIAQHAPMYWGSQPISSAPFYYGAVLCFLFVLGLFLVKGKDKWWIVAVVVLSFLLSLGKNFAFLSDLMLDYFPGYNKFRDVKNIIVIQQFAMALMGVLAVREIYRNRQNKAALLKHLKFAWFIVGGLALVFVVLPGIAGDFRSATDARLAQSGWPDQLIEALRDDRRAVLRTDAFKSLLFVSLAAGVIWLYVKEKIKGSYALLLWGLLIVVDMWPVDKRYLNNDNFVSKRKSETPFTPSKADELILKDKSPDYRVLNLAVNPWADASTSYFHKSLGGYSGAKMERYQELIEHHLSPEIQTLSKRLGNVKSQSAMDSLFRGLRAINMMNTKYIIYNPKAAPLMNPDALGNAWFVDKVETVPNANEEIQALGEINPANTAVVDHRFSDVLKKVQFEPNTESTIQLKEYQPNYLKYEATVESGTALAIFSEIYYPKGWEAYIDGKQVDIARADYVLRALPVPAGTHEIEFKFHPKSYYVGNKISMASSIILILAVLAVGFVEIRKKAGNEEEKTAGEEA
ncbi:MAG TPA: YfhO family protein [Sunxiuqinia sp.]|nr:YfhO family protein [Sunxiuqinia sp.]